MHQSQPNTHKSESMKMARALWRKTRRLFILIAGLTVILIGIVLLVTPGPAMLVIPIGLAILATEFVWAKKLLQRIKASASGAASAVRGRTRVDPLAPPSPPQSFFATIITRLRHTFIAAISPFRKGYVDAPPLLPPNPSDTSNPPANKQ